jgi:23S rRNA (uracil1939-C5)-methyltransferase
MNMKKGDLLQALRVESMAAEGKCVARLEGKVVFIEGAAPGDVVDARVTRVKSNFLEARLSQVVSPSADRVEPVCSHFGFCGGCKWQHLNYETQLRYKQQQVVDSLERIGGLTFPAVRPILSSPQTTYYRNRLDFSATNYKWLSSPPDLHTRETGSGEGLGFHVPKSFDRVFDVEHCYLQPDPSNAIRLAIKEICLREKISFFDLRRQTGYLRTVTIRTANTGEVMVIVQVAFDKPEWLSGLLNEVGSRFPQITSLLYVVNGKRNDTFHDLEIKTWKGNGYITETMNKPDGSGMLQFRIGPKSFYQTNSAQAERLYHTAWQMAALTGNEVVYDLYTGTGTIASYVAGHAKRVVGLEYIDAAIEDAKTISQLNGITNTVFYSGDIKDLLNESFIAAHGRPDVVITDPPRAGMHDDVCRMLLKAEPNRIVYVSCNPATQARDLKTLSEKYVITAVQPVDMFPHTMHVENVVQLHRI